MPRHCSYCGVPLYRIKDWNTTIDGFICLNENCYGGIPCTRYRQPQGFVRHFNVPSRYCQTLKDFLAGNEFDRRGDLQPVSHIYRRESI